MSPFCHVTCSLRHSFQAHFPSNTMRPISPSEWGHSLPKAVPACQVSLSPWGTSLRCPWAPPRLSLDGVRGELTVLWDAGPSASSPLSPLFQSVTVFWGPATTGWTAREPASLEAAGLAYTGNSVTLASYFVDLSAYTSVPSTPNADPIH